MSDKFSTKWKSVHSVGRSRADRHIHSQHAAQPAARHIPEVSCHAPVACGSAGKGSHSHLLGSEPRPAMEQGRHAASLPPSLSIPVLHLVWQHKITQHVSVTLIPELELEQMCRAKDQPVSATAQVLGASTPGLRPCTLRKPGGSDTRDSPLKKPTPTTHSSTRTAMSGY